MLRFSPLLSSRVGRLSVLCTIVAGATVLPVSTSPEHVPEFTVAKVEARAIAPKPVARPRRIVIPGVDIDAPVDTVGILPNGQMDVPPDPSRTGWYTGSPKPGEKGTAIIDGHLENGRPGAFWNLKKTKEGQRIYVVDDTGKRRLFKIAKTKVYDVVGAPLEEIYSGGDGKHLHLITCAGKWNTALGHYDKRLVVFAEAVESL